MTGLTASLQAPKVVEGHDGDRLEYAGAMWRRFTAARSRHLSSTPARGDGETRQ
jgi:hypothetical protein